MRSSAMRCAPEIVEGAPLPASGCQDRKWDSLAKSFQPSSPRLVLMKELSDAPIEPGVLLRQILPPIHHRLRLRREIGEAISRRGPQGNVLKHFGRERQQL